MRRPRCSSLVSMGAPFHDFGYADRLAGGCIEERRLAATAQLRAGKPDHHLQDAPGGGEGPFAYGCCRTTGTDEAAPRRTELILHHGCAGALQAHAGHAHLRDVRLAW